jgi:hypothetical protein
VRLLQGHSNIKLAPLILFSNSKADYQTKSHDRHHHENWFHLAPMNFSIDYFCIARIGGHFYHISPINGCCLS